MYKILIVDDEQLVRSAIIKKLDWDSIGFSDVYEAEDGEQALEIAMSIRPDVVLTDIRMPFMDGLVLAGHLSEKLPDTKVVILSGHDEFEYARDAIHAGVYDYILKPVKAITLIEILEKLKKTLDNENDKKIKLAKIKSQLHQSLPLLKERFLNALISNSIRQTELNKKLDYLDIDINSSIYSISVTEIDNTSLLSSIKSQSDMDLLSFSVLNIMSELVGKNGIVFTDVSNRHVVLFTSTTTDFKAFSKNIYEILESIRYNIETYLEITVTTGIGSIADNLRDVSISYEHALHALEYKIILGRNKILDINDLGIRETSTYYPLDMINTLLTKIKLDNTDDARAFADEFFKQLKEMKNITSNNIKIILSDLVNGIQRILLEINSENNAQASMDFSIYNEIDKHETLDEIRASLINYITAVSNQIQLSRNSRNSQIINKAKQFITDNYSQENLSLNGVAGVVAVSPGYLSILFRKECDETFIEYLTRVRMEKAKELLRTSALKAYEVAYRVGYSDPHYFSICFKKYTGTTPSEYKGNN